MAKCVCPSCLAVFQVDSSKLGKKAKCSKCGTAFTLQTEAPQPLPLADEYDLADPLPIGGDPHAAPPPLPAATARGLPEYGPYRQAVGLPFDLMPSYERVPWYRRSGGILWLMLPGLLFGPLMLAVCLIVITGPVYYPKLDKLGRVRTWDLANKVVAVIILAVHVISYVSLLRGNVR